MEICSSVWLDKGGGSGRKYAQPDEVTSTTASNAAARFEHFINHTPLARVVIESPTRAQLFGVLCYLPAESLVPNRVWGMQMHVLMPFFFTFV